MPQGCAVPLCSEKNGGHKFPNDETLLKQWLAAIRRHNYIPSKHARVCRKHFKPEDYALPMEPSSEYPKLILKKKVVPSLFSWNIDSGERKGTKRRCVKKSLNHQNLQEIPTLCSIKEEPTSEEYFTFDETCQEIEIEIDIQNSKKNVAIQCSLCNCEVKNSSTANFSKHESNRKRTLNMFRIENLKNKPDIVQFYTGFGHYNNFMFVFDYFGNEVNNLKYYPALWPARGNYQLTTSNQFYLTLIKLRRNMCDTELSFHFEISIASVGKYFITWINYLYCKFKKLNVCKPNETVDENETVQRKTKTCTVIILDCSEPKIEYPRDPLSQDSYSSYESCNNITTKVLVGISDSRCVTFVSEAYDGSIGDQELLEKCGVNNMCQKDDTILCNQDVVSHLDATVNMPQYREKDHKSLITQEHSKLLEIHQLRTSKKESYKQVNIERFVGLSKAFRIISNNLETNLEVLRGKIIFVCFMLTHLKNNLCNVNNHVR